jgi:hypothetical protein
MEHLFLTLIPNNPVVLPTEKAMQYYKRHREERLETLVLIITLIRSIAYRYESEN